MDPAGLDRDLGQGSLKAVYLLHGQDTLWLERSLKRIEAMVPEGMADFNLQRMSAQDASPGEVLSQARTMPFMSRPRVVVVRGMDHYKTEVLAPFLEYLDDPNTETCLVLVAEKPDFRLKFYKTLRDRAMDVAFEAPKGKRMVPWLVEAMARRGQKLTSDGARALIDRLGADPAELDQELEKISLYALNQETIGEEEVRAAARFGPTASVFELGDAIGEQNPGRALTALDDLLRTGHHLPVLAMITRHFRMLLKARLLVERRESVAEAARVFKLPPFVVGKYLEQARGLSLKDIKKGLARLQEANLTLVTSSIPDRQVMDRLVLNLALLRPGRRPGT
ncbi:MAG: DNA polymerase III subunit delta [Proteobacteria bacterium]|nr:DNA polymerase III subunit delta [Pseudomonadota bacterium]